MHSGNFSTEFYKNYKIGVLPLPVQNLMLILKMTLFFIWGPWEAQETFENWPFEVKHVKVKIMGDVTGSWADWLA